MGTPRRMVPRCQGALVREAKARDGKVNMCTKHWSCHPAPPITGLEGDLLHYSYPTIASHEERIERYSTCTRQGMRARGKKAGPVKRWLSPVAKFVQGYFFQLGLLDGRAGWKIAHLERSCRVLEVPQAARAEQRRCERLSTSSSPVPTASVM